MRTVRLAGLELVCLVAFGAAAFAQGGPGRQAPPRPVLLALDTDHDGVLSVAEIAAAPAVLAKLDTDGDGVLTSLEYLPNQGAAPGQDPDALVKQMMLLDANGDGVLTANEVPERMQGMFTRADANHDGKLTADEIRASALKQSSPRGRAEHSGQATRMDPVLNVLDTDHDGVLSAAEMANASAALKTLDLNGDGVLTADETKLKQMTVADRVAHMLDEWDTNKDGRIARAEAPDRMQEQFATLDRNGDGFLDVAELTAYFAAMPPQR
jgi:Ca2+-binding EF-hand superfamily protein